MSISLVKPTAIGTMLSITNSEGERHEWIVIGHERKGGRYTGYLRVEHKGWLSASILEADALADHVDAAHTETLEDMGFCEVPPAVSLVKPFPKGARVMYWPTFGKGRPGTVLGQRWTGQWAVKLDGRTMPVSGGTLQLSLI
jgi:hypothetical protein